MRGDCLHNYKAEYLKNELSVYPVGLYSEYRIRRNGITADFDFVLKIAAFWWAIEIETTLRHLVDNAKKAAAVNIPLWIVVPTRQMKKQAVRKLSPMNLTPGGEPIKLFLLGQVQKEVSNYLSRGNIPVDAKINEPKMNVAPNIPLLT